MLILGIDPGSRFCGYGLIEVENRKITAAGCDAVKIPVELNLPGRLNFLYTELTKVILEYKPDVMSVESIFYSKNVKSSFILGHVRGVVLLLGALHKMFIAEYTPKEIKKSITGNGNASKRQVGYMVSQILNINKENPSEDAMDALAAAFCYYNREKFRSF
ncbi:MAG: crossover junction endodeoxyribonuclease RuvC [Candidatus Cloacimonadota bacterium]|nr:MAG: crossover junction endodeoxyribonuclease RuvC [Candidatus Cloacimonadota bacterium]